MSPIVDRGLIEINQYDELIVHILFNTIFNSFSEQDKENDARNAQGLATPAAIQRRKRPKRRSTGVVAFDNMDVSTTYSTLL